jgi:hypothetical protein
MSRFIPAQPEGTAMMTSAGIATEETSALKPLARRIFADTMTSSARASGIFWASQSMKRRALASLAVNAVLLLLGSGESEAKRNVTAAPRLGRRACETQLFALKRVRFRSRKMN